MSAYKLLLTKSLQNKIQIYILIYPVVLWCDSSKVKTSRMLCCSSPSSALLRAESCTQTLSSTVESGDFPAVLWSYEVWSSGDWGPPHNGGQLEFWFIMFADNIIISNAVTGWMGWWWIVSWPLISSHASSAPGPGRHGIIITNQWQEEISQRWKEKLFVKGVKVVA